MKAKYIDAEKLINMIDNSIAYCQINYSDDYAFGFEHSLRRVKDFIDYLQQEVDLEKEIDAYTTEQYHKVFDGTGTLDEFDWEDVASVIEDTAHYFYELRLNARKEE